MTLIEGSPKKRPSKISPDEGSENKQPSTDEAKATKNSPFIDEARNKKIMTFSCTVLLTARHGVPIDCTKAASPERLSQDDLVEVATIYRNVFGLDVRQIAPKIRNFLPQKYQPQLYLQSFHTPENICEPVSDGIDIVSIIVTVISGGKGVKSEQGDLKWVSDTTLYAELNSVAPFFPGKPPYQRVENTIGLQKMDAVLDDLLDNLESQDFLIKKDKPKQEEGEYKYLYTRGPKTDGIRPLYLTEGNWERDDITVGILADSAKYREKLSSECMADETPPGFLIKIVPLVQV